ncbi:MAG: exonuclease domain-containing protein [Verrucomicrobiota bacterium]
MSAKNSTIHSSSVSSAGFHSSILASEAGEGQGLPSPALRPSVELFQELMPANAVVVDVETTGLHSERNSLIEIGARFPDGDICQFDFRPRPGAAIDAEALEVNGWTLNRLDEIECGYYEGVAHFFDWLKPHGNKLIMAGLNPAKFDLAFLVKAWSDLGRNPRWFPFSHRVIDLQTLAITYAILRGTPVPDRGFSCDDISRLLGIPQELRPHRAWRGATWCSEGIAKVYETLRHHSF